MESVTSVQVTQLFEILHMVKINKEIAFPSKLTLDGVLTYSGPDFPDLSLLVQA